MLVDLIVGAIWTVPLLPLTHTTYVSEPRFFHFESGPLVGAFAIGIVYFTLMEGLFGASIGKFVTGIRVVKEDGTRADVGAALIRNTLRVVDVLPFFYLLGAILIWTSPTKQRLGDRVAKTVVVTASSVGAAPNAGAWTPPAGPVAPGGPPPIPPPPPMPGAPGPVSQPDPVPPPGLVPPPDVVPTPGPVPPADPEPSSAPDPVPPPETVRSPDPVPSPDPEPQPPPEG
jgi:uncharacterized RDD family membrane protein YckC